MQSLLAVLALLSAVSVISADDSTNTESTGPVGLAPGEIIELSDSTFNSTLQTVEYMFIDFMSKSCGVCRRLKPEIEEAAAVLHQQGSQASAGSDESILKGVQFAQVNANIQEELSLRFDIKATPTFMLLTGGKSKVSKKFIIEQQPTSGGLVSEIRQKLGLKPVSRVKVIPESWSTTDVFGWVFWRGGSTGRLSTTLLYFAPSPDATGEGPKAAEALESALHDLSKILGEDPVTSQVRIAVVPPSRADLRKAFRMGDEPESMQAPRAFLYREHDDPKKLEVPLEVKPSHEDTVGALAAWVREQDVPLVDFLEDAAALKRYRQRQGLDFAMVFVPEDAIEIPPARKDLMKDLGERVSGWVEQGLLSRGQLTFLLVNGQKFAAWFPEFGLEKRVLPAMGIHERGGQQLWGEEAAAAALDGGSSSSSGGRMYGVAGKEAKEWEADDTEAYRRHQKQIEEQKAAEELDQKVKRGEATPTPMPTPKPFGNVPEVPASARVALPYAEMEQLLRKRAGLADSGKRAEEL